jgi:hypothetical protein
MSTKLVRALLAVLVGATVLTGCLAIPGRVDLIELVGSTTVDGWRYDHYRNRAYPCAISGFPSFVIGTRVGSDPNATRPLHVKMHGGGVGYFDATGTPVPSTHKREESRASLIDTIDDGLMARVMDAPEGFRVMSVSMCSHDLYAGANTPDPNNPNLTPDGQPRTTNGFLATTAAIHFATGRFPTDDFFLHGGSAGSAGTFHVAWGLQLQNLPPAGIVADSGILNQLYELAQIEQGLDCARTADAVAIVPQRFHHDIADAANQPHLLVAEGRLTVPVLHVWNHGDPNVCGFDPITCPVPGGTTVAMGSADCAHEPMRRAIAAQGPTSRSANLAVCVDDPTRPLTCDKHVVSNAPLVNTDPAVPADYNGAILAWMRSRMADD